MNNSSIAYEQKVRANDLVLKLDYVKVGSLAKAQSKGKLSFSIPGRSKRISAIPTHLEYFSESNYKWYGKADNGLGDVILLSDNGKITGHISLPDGIYEIYTTPDGENVVTTIDHVRAVDIKCNASEKNSISVGNGTTKENLGARLNPCNNIRPARALFLITQAARNLNPNIDATVNLSISQFNSCIYNSAITSQAVVELAGIQDFDFVETSNDQDDLARLSTNVTAQMLRNSFFADIVVLFTNDTYIAQGRATIGPNNNLAYAIAEVNHATASKTFAHEIGHLYGGKHHNDSSDPAYARGYFIRNWLGTIKGCTIMVTQVDGGSRLLNFSNPNLGVNGRATGTSSNNNALRVTETFAALRSFRTDPPFPFAVYLEGPYDVSTEGFRTYEAVYSCGSSPYTFSWEVSYDGVNYSSVSGSNDTYNHPFYSQGNEPYWFYVRLTALDGNGAMGTAIQQTYVGPFGGGGNIARIGSSPTSVDSEIKSETESGLVIYPNPLDEITTIEYSLSTDNNVELELINSSGATIKLVQMGLQGAGVHAVSLDMKNIQPGLYYCRVKTEDSIFTKLILLKKNLHEMH